MDFEWDDAKSKRTEIARGLTFDYAAPCSSIRIGFQEKLAKQMGKFGVT